jgi:glycosyltransferase involved in cell wall biosynthesis
MVSVAAVVLALNEEIRIADCLRRLRPYVDFILVLDGESVDRTVEFAKKYADSVVVKPFSGSFAEEKNFAWSLLPASIDWVLFSDVDEIFDESFLKNMKSIVSDAIVDSFRFPRVNSSTGAWPDYQVRLLRNNAGIEWRRPLHEIPYRKRENVPVDQVSVKTLDDYPIIHLPRRMDMKRGWW